MKITKLKKFEVIFLDGSVVTIASKILSNYIKLHKQNIFCYKCISN